MRKILLEYSEIIRKMRQYPNGDKLARLAHSDFMPSSDRPMADAQWTELTDIRKLPIGEIKKRERNTYIFFANDKNSLYIVANKRGYLLVSIKKGKVARQELNPKQITADTFRAIVNDSLSGPPTKIYVDAFSGAGVYILRHTRELGRQSDQWPIVPNTKSAVEVIIEKIKPLVKNYLRQAIAEIRGDIMMKIKSGAARPADYKITKLRQLIEAYETLSFDVEDNMTLNIIKAPLATAFRIVAKKYYPDYTGHAELSPNATITDYTYVRNLNQAEKELINNIMMLIYGYQQDIGDEPLTPEEIMERQKLAKKQLGDLLHVAKKLILKI